MQVSLGFSQSALSPIYRYGRFGNFTLVSPIKWNFKSDAKKIINTTCDMYQVCWDNFGSGRKNSIKRVQPVLSGSGQNRLLDNACQGDGVLPIIIHNRVFLMVVFFCVLCIIVHALPVKYFTIISDDLLTRV